MATASSSNCVVPFEVVICCMVVAFGVPPEYLQMVLPYNGVP